MNALARGAGVDPRLAVLVAAPREESAVAVRGARVPSAEEAHAASDRSPVGTSAEVWDLEDWDLAPSSLAARRLAACTAATALGRGIHSSSTSWPRVSCEFQPQVYSAPEEASAALLRDPARMALVGAYRGRERTVSPSGRARMVGAGTCQSSAHRLCETGASGRPSWPSSPQPHCGVGRRAVGQEGVEVRGGPFDVGLNRAGSSVRARAGSRVGVRDPEARRTTNSVSVSSSSSAMESPSRSAGENSALARRRPSWKTSEFSRRR